MSRAREAIEWIEEHLRVPDGADVGKPLRLRDWQKDEIRKIYDNPAGTRQAILSFGRKNGKTVFAAALCLLHLCGPMHLKNSQLYSAARAREQAALTFNYASKMVRMSESISAHVVIRESRKELVCPALGTMYRALSSDATTAFGMSPVFIVHDELGQVRGPRSALYEALETGCAAHDNPLSIVISTQAPTDEDLLSILIDDAMAGHDPKTVISLWTADTKADPFAEETIRQANPAFGDFQNAEELVNYAQSARRMPSKENEYRNLYLNQRVQVHNPFVSRGVWESCGEQPEPFGDEPVYGGLDLSSRTDLTACMLTFERNGAWHAHSYFWVPADGLAERSRADRVPYDLWAQQGFLRTTPGGSVDYEYVVADLAEILADVNLEQMAFDRWRIDVFKKELERAGVHWPMREWGQGYRDMSPALDALESHLVNARLRHGMHPVLTMCAANAIATRNPAGDRKLDKSKAFGRIDGMQALAMALGVAEDEPAETYAIGRLVAL